MKAYDREYFDRWYRDPRVRVATDESVARKIHLVISVAEALLLRQVRSVLDVGCGEGTWRAPLKKLRPSLRYVGVDSSEYVIARFGNRRGIRRGTFGGLGAIEKSVRGPFDVIVCCDMLQYVPADELRAGLASIAALLGGVAYLEAYTSGDSIEGDRRGWHSRSAAVYRRAFRGAGLVSVGMHCWVGAALQSSTAELERADD
ncbi:MAG TPA: class I SAM-dependent methyltransferase [Gemmatimonadaceae bacterium]|jgi:SAM-dependent methyltransferase|nr:class I SAM-dependent methyltransferase [Gemmatimonadaceae bacterium]